MSVNNKPDKPNKKSRIAAKFYYILEKIATLCSDTDNLEDLVKAEPVKSELEIAKSELESIKLELERTKSELKSIKLNMYRTNLIKDEILVNKPPIKTMITKSSSVSNNLNKLSSVSNNMNKLSSVSKTPSPEINKPPTKKNITPKNNKSPIDNEGYEMVY